MRNGGLAGRHGFTLVEVLVTVAIIVVLVALFGGAISAARSGSQANSSSNAVARLDQIITTQFRRYEARSVARSQLPGISNESAARAWKIRRDMITADMPDRWSDVQHMAANPGQFTTPAQRSYIASYNAASPKPTDQYGGAECLFMIVMQGGFADCLDCNGLAQLKKGDKDKDGQLEFWDDWNNPIDYLLWAPAFRNSGDSAAFFTSLDAAFPATGAVRPGLGMRPLIYSAGPDGRYGLNRNPTGPPVTALDTGANAANLTAGANGSGLDCGNPRPATGGASLMGGPGAVDGERADNAVNVEFKANS